MTDGNPPETADRDRPPEIPEWDDEYLDRVGDRLMHNYDLEKDLEVGGWQFPMYGEMRMVSEKHFLHPALSYARHEAREHLLVARQNRVRVADLESLVDLGHDLSEDWIDADERHYGTDFSFVVVAASIPDDVVEFVEGFKERTMIKFGYYGHYEINLAVVAPDQERSVASESADVASAFRLWEPIEDDESRGLLGRLLG